MCKISQSSYLFACHLPLSKHILHFLKQKVQKICPNLLTENVQISFACVKCIHCHKVQLVCLIHSTSFNLLIWPFWYTVNNTGARIMNYIYSKHWFIAFAVGFGKCYVIQVVLKVNNAVLWSKLVKNTFSKSWRYWNKYFLRRFMKYFSPIKRILQHFFPRTLHLFMNPHFLFS